MYLSLLFYFIASIAVGSAIFVVLNRNAIYSAVSLVLCFFALAVLYLLLEAYFLAVLEIFIYAGAIMVLFLFAIMLLNLGREEALPRFMQLQRSLSLMLVLIFFFGIFLILFGSSEILEEESIRWGRLFFPNIYFPLKLLPCCCLWV